MLTPHPYPILPCTEWNYTQGYKRSLCILNVCVGGNRASGLQLCAISSAGTYNLLKVVESSDSCMERLPEFRYTCAWDSACECLHCWSVCARLSSVCVSGCVCVCPGRICLCRIVCVCWCVGIYIWGRGRNALSGNSVCFCCMSLSIFKSVSYLLAGMGRQPGSAVLNKQAYYYY